MIMKTSTNYEVFIRSARGLDHIHVGSLHAKNPQQALLYARDVYIRRAEGISIWVVEQSNIHTSSEQDVADFVDPMNDKNYRHAKYYSLPDDVNNM